MFRSWTVRREKGIVPVIFSIWAAAILVVAGGAGEAASEVDRNGPALNRWGLPVFDALGQPLVYGREEIEARRQLTRTVLPAPRADSIVIPSAVPARWGYAGFGMDVGRSGIVLSDGEILAGGSLVTFWPNDYFYILRPGAIGYDQVFVSRRLTGLIALGVADVVGDARKEIVAAQSNGTISIWDQRSREEVGGFTLATGGLASMTLSALSGDGTAEILVVGDPSIALRVYSGAGLLLWQAPPSVGGVDVTVGNMDADPSPEIATTSGAVIDWATRTVQWQRAEGFGIHVASADIDGDGMAELVAAQQWDLIWAFDVDTQLAKWSLPIQDPDAIWVGNADSDPGLEVVVGDGQFGSVRAFDALTLVQEWAIPNPLSGVTSIAIGDTDGDGVLDMAWGSGSNSTGPDRLNIANLATRTLDWQNPVQIAGPFGAPQTGDIDGDGKPEIVTVSGQGEAGYASGSIVVLDAETLRVRAISPPVALNGTWSGGAVYGINDVKLRNVDGDPQLEIVIATDMLYDGLVEIYDFTPPASFFRKWINYTLPPGHAFFAVDVADIDGDGDLEVVGNAGPAGLFVYSYASRTEEWHASLTSSSQPGNGLAVLTDGGGIADIVAMVNGEGLTLFTGTGQPKGAVPGPFRYLAPLPGAASRSFVASADGGDLRIYGRQANDYAVTWSRVVGGAPVDGLTILDGGAMAVTADGRLTLYPDRDAPTPAWTSQDYGTRGGTLLGNGFPRRVLVGGAYAIVGLAPWRTLLSVQPTSGPSAGGTLVSVVGTNFDPTARMFVGPLEATGTLVPDSTHASGTTAALPACTVNDVAVANADLSFEIAERAFTASCGACPVSPATVAPATIGDPYSQAFTQAGGSGPIAWSLSGSLPSGVTFNGGVLAGTPAQTGVFPIEIQAVAADGCTGARSYSFDVKCQAITLAPSSVGWPTVGVAYSQAFSENAGLAPIAWSVVGALPGGLTINPSTGVLSGTPTEIGPFPLIVRATDRNGCVGSRNYSFIVRCQSITVDPPTIPAGSIGAPYSQAFTQSNGIGQVTWSLSGPLPPGLVFDPSTAVLSGTPTQGGTFDFQVRATDSNGCVGSRWYTLVVPCPMTVEPTTIPSGTAGSPYSQVFTVTGGSGSMIWTIYGNPPTGVTFNSSTHALAGTPVRTGAFLITIEARDTTNGCFARRSYTLVINCQAIVVDPPTLPRGKVGWPYSQAFTQNGGIGTIYWSSTGSLPPGLTFGASAGVLAGTPGQWGRFSLGVTTADVNGCSGSRSYVLDICRAVGINCPPGSR